MYRKCVTEVSVTHQRQVTGALLELMQKMPYEEITVTELCETAGISRRVFYHLFSNKTGALYALVDHKILDAAGYDCGAASEVLRFFYYWKEQKPFLDALWENEKSGLLLERIIDSVLTEEYDLLHWLQHNGWQQHSSKVVIFAFSGLMGLLYSWYCGGFREEPDQMAALVEQLIRPYITK